MGLSRKHRLLNGAALNRRLVHEMFLQAAASFRELGPDNLGRKQLGRSAFESHTFEEYWYAGEFNMKHRLPTHGYFVPGTANRLVIDDAFYNGEVSWSAEIKADADDCKWVMGWPVVDGQAIWNAEGWALRNSQFKYTGGAPASPDGDEVDGDPFVDGQLVSIGGCAAFGARNGRAPTGVFIWSPKLWTVVNAQIVVRTLYR